MNAQNNNKNNQKADHQSAQRLLAEALAEKVRNIEEYRQSNNSYPVLKIWTKGCKKLLRLLAIALLFLLLLLAFRFHNRKTGTPQSKAPSRFENPG